MEKLIFILFVIPACTFQADHTTKHDKAMNDSINIYIEKAHDCMRSARTDLNECFQYYERAIELNPKSVWTYHNRAISYFSCGVLGQKGPFTQEQKDIFCKAAIEDYDMIISICPRDYKHYKYYDDYKTAVGGAWSGRASCNKELGNLETAISDCSHAIEMGFSNYDQRASLKFDLGDYRGAIQDYNVVIENLTAEKDLSDSKRLDLGGYYNIRGIAKIKLGDVEGGCLDCSKAGELGWTFAYENINKYCK